MQRFRTQWNYVPTPGEKNSGINNVIPGQSYSVQEALNRIRKGLTIPGRNYAYQDDEDHEPPMRMNDLTDLDYAKTALKNIRKEQADAVKKIKEAAAKKAAESYTRDDVSGV